MINVFGGVRLERGGVDVPLGGQMRDLLGIVAADAGRPVSVSALVDRLWTSDPPARADKVVQVVIGRLRRSLEPELAQPARSTLLTTTADGYVLQVEPDDLAAYLAAESAASAAEVPAVALTHLERALALWRGRPWGGQADQPWLRGRVDALEEHHRRTEERWADLSLRCGHAEDVAARLQELADREPLRERRWSHLMLALYRSGRQADALRAFDEARRVLRDELGLEPGPELRRLQLAILQQDPALAATSLEAGRLSSRGSFIGRTAELEQLGDALERAQIVTVVGLGGMGKSRLAAEHLARRRLVGDRVLRVSLATLRDASRLDTYVCDELGLYRDDVHSAWAVLAAFIGETPTLLLLDGAEAATAEVGHFALRLTGDHARLAVLVTSRVPLGVGVERTVPLGPLPLGELDEPVDGSALQLLVDRAGYDSQALDPQTRAHLRDSCRATGGIPLLVELAAPTVTTAFVTSAGSAIRSNAASHRDLMRAAIAHALEAVDEPARELLRGVTCLAGGVSEETVAAIASVAPDVARRHLRQLGWSRLVEVRSGAASLRFTCLDPVRETLLDEQEDEAGASAFERAIGAIESVLASLRPSPVLPRVAARLDAIADEHDNLLQVLTHLVDLEPERALNLAIVATEYWPVRGRLLEGRRWIERTTEEAQPTGELAWRALLALLRTHRTFAESATLRQPLEQAVEEMRRLGADPVVRAAALMHLAGVRGWTGDLPGADRALDEASIISKAIGSPWSDAGIDHLRGLGLALTGDLLGARDSQRVYAQRMVALDDPLAAAQGWYLAVALGDMAGQVDVLDDLARARELAEWYQDVGLLSQLLVLEGRLRRRTGDERGTAILAKAADRLDQHGGIRAAAVARRDLGLIELESNRVAEARHFLRPACATLLQLDPSAAALALAALAVIETTVGTEAVARRLAAGARRLRLSAGTPSADDDGRASILLARLGFDADRAEVTHDELLELVGDSPERCNP